MAVDGFELAYDRTGSGPAVVLLHGWPGDRTDYRELIPLLDGCEVVAPDLRGFGRSDKHLADPGARYSAAANARSVAGLITELGLNRPVVFGPDPMREFWYQSFHRLPLAEELTWSPYTARQARSPRRSTATGPAPAR